jgi:hypothetical protein
MSEKKDTTDTLGRMAAPAATTRDAPPMAGAAQPQALDASVDTVNIGVARTVLLRLKRYALVLQEREGGRVTQRMVAERMLSGYLDGAGPAINLPETEPELPRPIGTLALDRGLLFRLKRHALDLEERLGRSVTMREVAEAIFNTVLDEAGIPAVPSKS